MIKPNRMRVTAKLAKAAVGSATLVATGGQMPADVQRKVATNQVEIAGKPAEIRQSEVRSAESLVTAKIVIGVPDFSKKDMRRLSDLAVKRALGEATKDEQIEFAALQEARRLAPENFSPDEVLAEYKRRKLLLETVNFLSRHVSFLRPSDQEKFRTLKEAVEK